MTWEIELQALIECTQKCTWSIGLTEYTVALETMIDCTGQSTSRQICSKLEDRLGGRDHVNLELYTDDRVEGVWKCTWRPRSSKLRNAH
jgi:hypothetical protein